MGLLDIVMQAAEMYGRPQKAVNDIVADPRQRQGLLDAAALGTAPAPVVGDAMGLLSDVHRYATQPEERTWQNFGLTGLGMLPFIPPLAATKKVLKPAMEVLPADAIRYGENADDFVYHVTTEPNAKKILKDGFSRSPKRTIQGGFYNQYSKDKTFFTDRDGVGYWRDKIETHLDHAMDDPPPLVVLRIPKKDVPLVADDIGTKDAKHPAYYFDWLK